MAIDVGILEWAIGGVGAAMLGIGLHLNRRISEISDASDDARNTARTEMSAEMDKIWTSISRLDDRINRMSETVATKTDVRDMEHRVTILIRSIWRPPGKSDDGPI